jgi:hypothetical protein
MSRDFESVLPALAAAEKQILRLRRRMTKQEKEVGGCTYKEAATVSPLQSPNGFPEREVPPYSCRWY